MFIFAILSRLLADRFPDRELISATGVKKPAETGSVAMKNLYMEYMEVLVLTVVVAGCYLMVTPM
jgi:hypothetical protein